MTEDDLKPCLYCCGLFGYIIEITKKNSSIKCLKLNVEHEEFKNGALQHMLNLYPLDGADLKTWVDAHTSYCFLCLIYQ